MIVCADDLNYASKIVPDIVSWKSSSINNINRSHCSFIGYILKSKNIYYSEIESDLNWQYLILSKHSPQSQFDLLYNLIKNDPDLPDGILCLADSGSEFHGHRNRTWNARSGNLHLSLLKKPGISVTNFSVGFTILAAVSVLETIDIIPGLKEKAWIKWVNDIYINNFKVSGVITKTQTIGDNISSVIFGIGLNIEKAPEISSDLIVKKSTCLNEFIKNKKKYSMHFIFNTLLSRLSFNYVKLLNKGYKNLFEIYCQRTNLIGEKVVIYSDRLDEKQEVLGKGRVVNIGENLELYLKNEKKPITQGRLVIL